MTAAQLAEAIKAGLIAQGRQVPAAYAEHLQTLVDQGDQAVPLLEAALMAGVQQAQAPAPAGGVVQPPVGGDQQVQPTVDGQPPPVPDQPLDLDAENARVAAEVAINIATEQQEADIFDTRCDYHHLSVCIWGLMHI